MHITPLVVWVFIYISTKIYNNLRITNERQNFWRSAACWPLLHAAHRTAACGRSAEGVGSSFTNATMLEAYGLISVIYPGSILYTILDIMNQCGNAVFANLALLFAMYAAIGMAKKEKEVAACPVPSVTWL